MEFNGTFELEETTRKEVWLALSDPALIRESLPGCQFLVPVEDPDVDFDALRERQADDEPPEVTADPDVIEERAFVESGHYAALMQLSVGSVSPTFETVVTIDERAFPEMIASGEGSSGNSSFEMRSWMELTESGDGVAVEWGAEADVFGRIAQMGQRVINPVANRVVKRFFSSVSSQLEEMQLQAAEESPTEDATAETDEAASTAGDDGSTAGTADGTDGGSTSGSSGGIVARIKRLLGLGS